jgi:hypothetical protein
MPSTQSIITNLQTYFEEVASDDFTSTVLRQRILSRVQAVADYVWMFANWPWKEKVSELGAGSVDINAGYGEFQTLGRSGAVFYSEDDGASWTELVWKPSQDVQRVLAFTKPGRPEIYSVWSQGGSAATAQFLLAPTPDNATFILRICHEVNVPQLTDADPGGLDVVCDARYHFTVIEQGAIFHLMRDKGDGRWMEQRGIFLDGLGQMASHEVQERHTLHRMPRFGRG